MLAPDVLDVVVVVVLTRAGQWCGGWVFTCLGGLPHWAPALCDCSGGVEVAVAAARFSGGGGDGRL